MGETLRIATYNAGLTRAGPGLLLRDMLKDEDRQIAAVLAVIGALDADVLVLTAVDYDYGLVALGALADRLATLGTPYPYRFARQPNTGMATGVDLDGNGALGEARDAQGYGRFAGQAGMAVLSRLPIGADAARDFSGYLWRDLPGALLPDPLPAPDLQRLATTAHWEVPVALPGGQSLRLLSWYATPPVFDGPEDRNGRRNHDEAAFWARLIEGALPFAPPAAPFIVLGDANLDPVDGDGLTAGIATLLGHPALQDPGPRGTSGRVDPGQQGDPALDTADYTAAGGPGGLRVDYVLPSADMHITASGVMWPAADDPLAATLAAASRHRPVWVDIMLP
ncbi:MAG: endonuclease/exonuclease/phosphatase family protein [Pseudorhodobacter sp.]|nr:endonuclease/exonuclease/phosphatase family protein [Pseudorhodobacter sp.]